MASVNQCVFVGNLTRDAESKMVGETEVAKYAVAVNGRKEGKVLFVDCDHWRPGNVTEYLLKGTPVYVTGDIDLQTWEKDGQTRSKLVLNVRNLQLLGGGRKREEQPEEEFTTSPF